MSWLDDLEDIYGVDSRAFDDGTVHDVRPPASDAEPKVVRAMLDEKGPRGGPRWPRFRDLVAGKPAKGLKDSTDESDRDFHIGLCVASWIHGRPFAPNGAAPRVLALDVPEDVPEIAQIIADVVSYCRAQREDAKGKARDARYLGRTAARVIQAARESIKKDPAAAPGQNGEGRDEHDEAGDEAGLASLVAAIRTGEALRALTDREPLPPVYPGTPPRGHLTLRIGASFVGKTTAEVHNAMARAAGVAPWEGAPAFEPGRTLIVAPDEPIEQIARQIRRLAWKHPGGRLFDYFAQIAVIGLDSGIPMDALAGLRFHDEGFRLIDALVTRGRFDALVIDAYADMLPPGENEHENETASRIGGALEALAVKHSIPIVLIHHVGKTGGRSTAEIDVRDLGRGASALAAKARCIHTFEEVESFPNQRRIRTRTNLTRSPAPLDLLVSDRGTAGSSIDFFRPLDPASQYPVGDVLPEIGGEWISTSELARRLSGNAEGKPGGHAVALAKTVRGIWLGAGLIEIQKGANRATECRRIR